MPPDPVVPGIAEPPVPGVGVEVLPPGVVPVVSGSEPLLPGAGVPVPLLPMPPLVSVPGLVVPPGAV